MTQLDRLEALAERGEAWIDFYAFQDEAAPDVALPDLIRVARAAKRMERWQDQMFRCGALAVQDIDALLKTLAPLFAEVES